MGELNPHLVSCFAAPLCAVCRDRATASSVEKPRVICSMAEALLQIHLRLNCGLGARVFR